MTRFLLMIILVGVGLIPHAHSHAYAHTNEERSDEALLQWYIGRIQYTDNASECVREIDNYAAQFVRRVGRNLTDPEKRAYTRTREICAMEEDDIFALAEDYAHGTNGVAQNTETAKKIFFHLYFGRGSEAALYRLKDLGANVVTEPMSDAEWEALQKEVESLKSQEAELQKSLEESKRVLRESEKSSQIVKRFIEEQLQQLRMYYHWFSQNNPDQTSDPEPL